MHNPYELLSHWLVQEKEKGAPNPQHAVLSTMGLNAAPSARVIAIREINEQELLFFTSGTRKVTELNQNPKAVITFWFELWQREVIIEGNTTALSQTENETYWRSYPREAQIRFHSYAPTSSRVIINKQVLEEKRQAIKKKYDDQPIPISPFYSGFRLTPTRIIFYAYRTDALSDVSEYTRTEDGWIHRILSP
jgi:pyridoxamine 5'-phosphate oxidase